MTLRATLYVVVASTACGRVDFDALTHDVGTGSGDGATDATNADSAVDAIPGLVVVYPMDDNPAPTGTVTASVPADDGTCTACPAPTAGHINGALEFDGSDCVTLPTSTLIGSASYTVAAWILAQNTAQASAVSKAYGDTVNYDIGNLAVYASGSPFFETSDAAGSVDIVQPPTAIDIVGAWHHVAITWNATAMLKQLYIDGTLSNAQNVSTTDSTELVKIGCDTDFGSEDFNFVGALDDVRFYSRDLTSTEIGYLASE
jgi:Concanavalin A-like lectin/glucanases superfamily